jgi:hypothetical protein
MKKMMMVSITGLSKEATLKFFVEKPPVAIVANEWFTASNRLMPAKVRIRL